jgi:hypothetical protein
MNAYCVILWPEPLVNPVSYPRTKRLFLRAPSADGAIQAALSDNPHWRVIGIEPKRFVCWPSTRCFFMP